MCFVRHSLVLKNRKFLRVFYITRTTGPFIYADGFGYCSHAAHLMKEQEIITCGLIAFAATCFPTYIFYSYTTMCETLLALLVWLLLYELISFRRKSQMVERYIAWIYSWVCLYGA